MPRLTNKLFLEQREELRTDWFEHHGWTFSRLRPREEMMLHAYFAPTEDFTAKSKNTRSIATTKTELLSGSWRDALERLSR